MIKKHFEVILTVLLLPLAAYSQQVKVSFTGSDTQTSAPIQLDSVRIQNLMTFKDTVLRDPFIIDLGTTTGVDRNLLLLRTSIELSGNFANPFTDQTRFQISTATSGKIEVELYSIVGKLIVSLPMNVSPGRYEFTLVGRGLSPGVYVLVARDGWHAPSVRIMKSGTTISGVPKITHNGTITETTRSAVRKTSSLSAYRFIGYASTYKPDSVLAAPIRDSTIEFKFQRGVGVETVTIGTQVWMRKNLDVTTYRNGDPIPQVTDATQWSQLTTGAWCYINNDSAMGVIYGKLYNWYAVNDPRGLAPMGWHVSSIAEWSTLITYLGGDAGAGGKMKESGTAHWYSPNTGADNSSGFTALPSGSRNNKGDFDFIRSNAYWWSSSELNLTNAWYRGLGYTSVDVNRSYYYKSGGFSVRCVRD